MENENIGSALADQDNGGKFPTLNTFLASLNLFNSIVGIGIISLPFAMLRGGVLFGTISATISCLFIIYTSDLMVKTALKINGQSGEEVTSYGGLCRVTISHAMFYVVCVIVFLMMFFAMSLYNVIFRRTVGSIISDIIGSTFYYENLVLIGVSLAIIWPLCLLKDISKLSYSSFVSTVFVVVIVLIVAVRSPVYHNYLMTMNKSRMIENELQLGTERSRWICGLAINGNPLYTYNSANFPIGKVTNYNTLFQDIRNKPFCIGKTDPERFNEFVTDYTTQLEFETIAGINPNSWVEVVQQAHANHLFSQYSLADGCTSSINAITLLQILGIFSSAFICQQTTFSIFGQLNRKTVREWRYVQLIGFIMVYVLCMSLAYSGYFSQLCQTGDSVFSKMKLRYYVSTGKIDIPTNLARVLLNTTILLTFPMQNFFCRRNVFLLLFSVINKYKNTNLDPLNPPNKFFYPVTIIILILTLIIGLFVDSIIDVYSLMGSICASPLIYIFPVLCFWSMDSNLFTTLKNKILTKDVKIIIIEITLPLIVLIFGIFTTVSTTLVTILQYVI